MKEIGENEFGTLTGSGVVLIDFGAEWCGPCKAILPTLQKLSTEYAGKMNIFSVDIDKSPDIAAKHGVMSVPTLLLFKNGQPVERIVGALSERDLRRKLEPHVA
jgi:thioredoxin 1